MTHPSIVADTLDARHDAGPWRVEADMRPDTGARPYNPDVVYLSGWNIYSDTTEIVGSEGIIPGLNAEANARLIAAAPDLLEALEAFAAGEIDVSGTALIYDADVRAMQQLARAAIAKARGEMQP